MENNKKNELSKPNNETTASPLWVIGGLFIFLLLMTSVTLIFVQYSVKNNSIIIQGKVILPLNNSFFCKENSGKSSLESFNYVQENKIYKFQVYKDSIINV